VYILNFAVRSAPCIRPEQFVDTEHTLDSDRTRPDINGEQKRSADDMCVGGDYMTIEWVGSTIERLKKRFKAICGSYSTYA
jgi:hypothetical protein